MTFTNFLAVLRARWISLLVTFGVVMVIATAVVLLLPTRYTSTAAVLIDVRPDPVSGVSSVAPSFLATQVDVITSERVARKVVQQTGISSDPTLRQQWLDSTGGRGDFESWVGDLLQKYLEVLPSKQSNVVSVSYSAQDPAFAALLTNAFVKAYIDTSLELRVDPARQFTGFFEVRAKQYRDALEQAKAKLSAFQREKGLIATDERIDIETARLGELSSQLVALQALSAESQSRQAQTRSSGDQMGEVINNSLISGLKANLSQQESRLEELNARLGEAHPTVIQAKASINELRSRIEAETKRVTGGVGVSNTINVSREAQIRASLDAQRASLLKLKETRDAAGVLARDVDSAQRAYDALRLRLDQQSLESQVPLSNVSVLSPAVESTLPSFPRVGLSLAVAAVVGMLLGVCVVLLRELLDRRVRTPYDLAEFEGAPLLVVMPGPAKKRRFGKVTLPLIHQRVLGQLPNSAARA